MKIILFVDYNAIHNILTTMDIVCEHHNNAETCITCGKKPVTYDNEQEHEICIHGIFCKRNCDWDEAIIYCGRCIYCVLKEKTHIPDPNDESICEFYKMFEGIYNVGVNDGMNKDMSFLEYVGRNASDYHNIYDMGYQMGRELRIVKKEKYCIINMYLNEYLPKELSQICLIYLHDE